MTYCCCCTPGAAHSAPAVWPSPPVRRTSLLLFWENPRAWRCSVRPPGTSACGLLPPPPPPTMLCATSSSVSSAVPAPARVRSASPRVRPAPPRSATTCPSQAPSVPGKPPPPAQPARVPATPCRASLLGAEFPRRPSGSRRIGGREAQSPKSRTANTRRRRCATPNHCASSTAHSTIPCSPTAAPSVPQPWGGTGSSARPASSSTTFAKSRPWLQERMPTTFSSMAKRSPQCFRAQRAIRTAWRKSPLRAPSRPARSPAIEKS